LGTQSSDFQVLLEVTSQQQHVKTMCRMSDWDPATRPTTRFSSAIPEGSSGILAQLESLANHPGGCDPHLGFQLAVFWHSMGN